MCRSIAVVAEPNLLQRHDEQARDTRDVTYHIFPWRDIRDLDYVKDRWPLAHAVRVAGFWEAGAAPRMVGGGVVAAGAVGSGSLGARLTSTARAVPG